MKELLPKPICSYNIEELPSKGSHLVLVNRKTGRTASSSTWVLGLAALAYQSGDWLGIMSLLPLAKARRLLKSNEAQVKHKRGQNSQPIRMIARRQAGFLLPNLVDVYLDALPSHKTFRKGEFCRWIVRTLDTPNANVSLSAAQQGYDELIDTSYSVRWWHEQVNKLQS